MKNKTLMMLKLIFTAMIFYCCTIFASEAAKPLDKIAAIVNDDIIMSSEIDQRISIIKKQMEQQKMPLPADEELRKQVLAESIDQSLELQVAKRAGLQISNDELNKTIESIAKANNMSVEQFKAAVEKEGINYADYRKQVHNQMLISRLVQAAIEKKPAVSDEEIDAFIKEQNIPDADSETTKKQVRELIYGKKMAEKVKEWLKEVRKTAYIKVVD